MPKARHSRILDSLVTQWFAERVNPDTTSDGGGMTVSTQGLRPAPLYTVLNPHVHHIPAGVCTSCL